VFLDPPYTEPDLLAVSLAAIEGAGPGGIVAMDGLVVVKHFGGAAVGPEVSLLQSVRRERFGDTALTFYRWADEGDA
jgi:16S rRNA G966 N2-methylase RsmD